MKSKDNINSKTKQQEVNDIEDFDFLEDGEDFEDFDEEEDQEDTEESQHTKGPLHMFITFGALIVIAAILCGALWFFTHMEKKPTQDVSWSNDEIQEGIYPTEYPATEGDPIGEGQPIGEEQPTGEGQPTEGQPISENPSEEDAEPISGNASMEFSEVKEEITAKDVTNVRSIPSTLDEESVVGQIKNGEIYVRTGINTSTGWSRILYNDQIVYAVSRYITSDINYKTPVTPANPNRVTTMEGRVIIFTDCEELITPKEYVNLRTEPSTSQGDATIRCQVKNGESVRRTGYSSDSGWSRVEYNSEILYVVSSLMKNVE